MHYLCWFFAVIVWASEQPQNLLSDEGKLDLVNSRTERARHLPEMALNASAANSADHSRALISGLQRFSLQLLKSLHNFEPKDQSTGLLFSPFSVWGTMVVALAGARGASEHELLSALGLKGVPRQSVLLAYQGLRFWYELKYKGAAAGQNAGGKWQKIRPATLRNGLGDDSSIGLISNGTANGLFATANRLFFNSNLRLSRTVRENFNEEIQSLDFVNAAENSRLKINNWVAQQTHGKIKDLLAPGCINSFTNIVITNAIYFQSKWLTQFEVEKTKEGVFQVNPTEESNVKYMHNTGTNKFNLLLNCTK